MVYTGFYDVATRKAGERRAERDAEFERKKRRLEELNIVIPTKDWLETSYSTRRQRSAAPLTDTHIFQHVQGSEWFETKLQVEVNLIQ